MEQVIVLKLKRKELDLIIESLGLDGLDYDEEKECKKAMLQEKLDIIYTKRFLNE